MENVPQPPILLFRNNQEFEACTSMGVTEMGGYRCWKNWKIKSLAGRSIGDGGYLVRIYGHINGIRMADPEISRNLLNVELL